MLYVEQTINGRPRLGEIISDELSHDFVFQLMIKNSEPWKLLKDTAGPTISFNIEQTAEKQKTHLKLKMSSPEGSIHFMHTRTNKLYTFEAFKSYFHLKAFYSLAKFQGWNDSPE